MRIGFMGTPDFAKIVLQGLIDNGHEVKVVLTQPDKAVGRGKKIQYSPVKELALKNNIPVWQPEKVKSEEGLTSKLKALRLDILIVVAYGQILPNDVIESAKYGTVNVHASLLPHLRGAAPIQRAIVSGDEITGVTIMNVAEKLDAGDMLSKVEVQIGKMNFEELHDKLAFEGTKLLLDTLKKIEEGTATYEKQDDEKATYAKMVFKPEGKIDFTVDPKLVECKIRGFDPWPGAFAYIAGDDASGLTAGKTENVSEAIKFWKAEPLDIKTAPHDAGKVIEADTESFTVSCGGKALRVLEIQVPGKKRCEFKEYVKGHSDIKIGTRFI